MDIVLISRDVQTQAGRASTGVTTVGDYHNF